MDAFTKECWLLAYLMMCTLSPLESMEWDYTCPYECSCYISTCSVLLLNAKVVNCENSSLKYVPKNISLYTEVLNLRHNLLGFTRHSRLLDVTNYSRIMVLDLSDNNLKAFGNTEGNLESIVYLNLSYNSLNKLEPYTFQGFYHVRQLNLRSNCITYVSALALELPKLQLLDLSQNKISLLQPHYFVHLRSIRKLYLSCNHISRVTEILQHSGSLDVVDLGENKITKVDDRAFLYLTRVTELNLANNHLSRVPHSALSVIPYIKRLNLDGNALRYVSRHSFSGINVSELQLSYNKNLLMIEKESFGNMKFLSLLNVSHCENLRYTHFEAFYDVTRLKILDLRYNGLVTLQEKMMSSIPLLETIFVGGNLFWCSCDIRWLQNKLQNSSISKRWKIDAEDVVCSKDNVTFRLKDHETLPLTCPSKVLPLFPEKIDVLPGCDLKLSCVALGVPMPDIWWEISYNSSLIDQHCASGTCTLTMHSIQERDNGVYTCCAKNALGVNSSSSVQLQTKSLNIKINVVAVGTTFITVSWNRINYLHYNYVVQYQDENAEKIFSKTIVLGWKAHSYTLSGLLSGKNYTIWLCLQRGESIMRLSSIRIATRDNYFPVSGINNNYLGFVLAAVVSGAAIATCLCACSFRLYKWQRRQHTEMALSENKAELRLARKKSHSQVSFTTYVTVNEEMTLVDNEDEMY